MNPRLTVIALAAAALWPLPAAACTVAVVNGSPHPVTIEIAGGGSMSIIGQQPIRTAGHPDLTSSATATEPGKGWFSAPPGTVLRVGKVAYTLGPDCRLPAKANGNAFNIAHLSVQ